MSSQRPLVLLTGATSGIGRATARRLASREVALILHGRTEEKVEAAREEIAAAAPVAALHAEAADLSDLAAVRDLADRVARRQAKLDVLINNAGLAGGEEHVWTVNVLAPFLLTCELRPLLQAAGAARVVNVASAAQRAVDLDALPRTAGETGPTSYGQSKLALIMLTLEMARRWRDDGITANALHPGTLLDTKMVRENYGAARGPADEGAAALAHLALADEVAGVSGQYFDQQTPAEPDPQARDDQARRRLWEITARAVGGGAEATG